MKNRNLNNIQSVGLILLRVFIGWHFLYEGIIKLFDTGWSAEGYLLNSRSFLSGLFHEMAANPAVLEVVNFLNIWGLILIGLALFLGLFARLAVFAGLLLLLFYYLAYPPFGGLNFGVPQEGHYMLVDKTFIELVALIVLAIFPQTLSYGVMNLLKELGRRLRRSGMTSSDIPGVSGADESGDPSGAVSALLDDPAVQPAAITAETHGRREMIKNLTFLPLLGGFSWAYSHSRSSNEADGMTGSTIVLNQRNLSEIEGTLPMGVLAKGKAPISRLIMGTNHLSGNAHARDLVYAKSLFKAYNTEKKIIETYMLADKAGVNLFFLTPLLKQYKKMYGRDFQTWINVAPTKSDPYGAVDKAIDAGVDYIFVQGAACDRRVYEGDVDVVVKCVEYIKKQGYPAGLGAHTIQAMLACDAAGVDPDFYYKTMHHDKYWSAHPRENRKPFLWSSNISEDHNEFHDNMWCLFPEETVDFVHRVQKPVVGFKVLAGGAIHPKDGFQWAFDHGADFIEVGMFDFQIVENVIQTIQSVQAAQNRTRPWYG